MKCLLLILSDRQFLSPSQQKATEIVTKHRPLEGDEKLATILEDRSSEFARLDRYERRAISRRKSAIRAFDSAHDVKE